MLWLRTSFLWTIIHDHSDVIFMMNFLKKGIFSIDWLLRSPNLNSIEHVWDDLGRAISQSNPSLKIRPRRYALCLNSQLNPFPYCYVFFKL
ncbi:hypothetical protein TNCV_3506261 [Trichonephila clavipes]|uniref:Uncharacterized protein n=1 Tax=Trichonephila clavipes TaxID=2585209 RepID=A0A8X6RYZ6_TRICX|nr:hypothetical protein TNCV_3506261 [Trichonephila clavipes]